MGTLEGLASENFKHRCLDDRCVDFGVDLWRRARSHHPHPIPKASTIIPQQAPHNPQPEADPIACKAELFTRRVDALAIAQKTLLTEIDQKTDALRAQLAAQTDGARIKALRTASKPTLDGLALQLAKLDRKTKSILFQIEQCQRQEGQLPAEFVELGTDLETMQLQSTISRKDMAVTMISNTLKSHEDSTGTSVDNAK